MAVRISGIAPPGNIGRPNRSSAKKSEEGPSRVQDGAEKVDLSAREAAVSEAQAAEVSEVDEAKVAALRAAIARGEYRADLKIVAERIIAEAMNLS